MLFNNFCKYAAIFCASIAILGCGGDKKAQEEAKRLGFADKLEMREIQEKGWHTQEQYVIDAKKNPSQKINNDVITSGYEAVKLDPNSAQAKLLDPKVQIKAGEEASKKSVDHYREVKASQWYTLAAASRNADAQVTLCMQYDNGRGVEQDFTKARYWCGLAAQQGEKSAQRYLNQEIRKTDKEVESDKDQEKAGQKAIADKKLQERQSRFDVYDWMEYYFDKYEWYLYILGFILALVLYFGFKDQCPSCTKLYARNVIGRNLLNQSYGTETVNRSATQKNNRGEVIGTTEWKQNVAVTYRRFQVFNRCKKCGHEWQTIEDTKS